MTTHPHFATYTSSPSLGLHERIKASFIFTFCTSQSHIQEYYLVKSRTPCKTNFLHVVEPQYYYLFCSRMTFHRGLLKYLISFTVMDISHRPSSSLEDSPRSAVRDSSFNLLAATPLIWRQSLPSIPSRNVMIRGPT